MEETPRKGPSGPGWRYPTSDVDKVLAVQADGSVKPESFTDEIWFGPPRGKDKHNNRLDDGVAHQSIVNLASKIGKPLIRWKEGDYFFSTFTDYPHGKTSEVGPGVGSSISCFFPGLVQPIDAPFRYIAFDNPGGTTTLVDPMNKGDISIKVSDLVPDPITHQPTIFPGAIILVGSQSTFVVAIAPSGPNFILLLWRPIRAKALAGSSVLVITDSMCTLNFDGQGTTCIDCIGERIFSLSKNLNSRISNFQIGDGHLPSQLGSWDNQCIGCVASNFYGILTKFTSDMSINVWGFEGGDDNWFQDSYIIGVQNGCDINGCNSGVKNSVIGFTEVASPFVLSAGQGFDAQDIALDDVTVSGGQIGVIFDADRTNQPAPDTNYDPVVKNCHFYGQSESAVKYEKNGTGDLVRPVVRDGTIIVSPDAIGPVIDTKDARLDTKDVQAKIINEDIRAFVFTLINAIEGVFAPDVDTATIVNLASVFSHNGNISKIFRFKKVDFQSPTTFCGIGTLTNTSSRFIIEDSKLDLKNAGGSAIFFDAASTNPVMELVRSEIIGVVELVNAAAGAATIRLRDMISYVGSIPAAVHSNVGTLNLNGVAVIDYLFPDLKVSDNISIVRLTPAGTPGPYDITIVPGNKVSVKGTALDTSTLQVVIGG